MGFEFELGAKVTVDVSGETGEVLGRAEYVTAANTYFVRYRSADGRAVEAWWEENALRRADE